MNVRPGMSLGKAKEALISKGWRPVNPHRGDGYRYIGVENDLINKGYQEIESCATDRALCIFVYGKNQKCIKLLTQGEEVQAMRVISISHGC